MNLVLKIAFNHLHFDNRTPAARALYESFFAKKSPSDTYAESQGSSELGDKIAHYVSSYVLEQDNQEALMEQSLGLKIQQ